LDIDNNVKNGGKRKSSLLLWSCHGLSLSVFIFQI
jgi:hypothetical protein